MKITVRARPCYGSTVFDPVSREAGLLCEIAGTKTATFSTLITARRMGAEVEVLGGEMPAEITAMITNQATLLNARGI